MTEPVVAVLNRLSPAAEDGWHVLFDLAEVDTESWVLIGGQMIYLLAVENGVIPIRATDDMDIAVDVRARPGATEWLADWLLSKGFALESVSADDIGHRFTRAADPGPGNVIVDVLACEGIGERTSIFTRRPVRTVQAPGATQAFTRSSVVGVTVSGESGRAPRTGLVRRPNLLGALVAKAAATTIAVRQNPDRDYEDAALLLSILKDPLAIANECGRSDIKRLRRLMPLKDERHEAWRALGADAATLGRDALGFLIG